MARQALESTFSLERGFPHRWFRTHHHFAMLIRYTKYKCYLSVLPYVVWSPHLEFFMKHGFSNFHVITSAYMGKRVDHGH